MDLTEKLSNVREQLQLKHTVAVLASVLIIGGLLLGYFALQPAEASVDADGLYAEDVHISSNEGEIKSIYMNPTLNVSWKNLRKKVSKVKIGYTVRGPSNANQLSYRSYSVSDPSRSGSIPIQSERINLSQNGPLQESSFEPSADNTSESGNVTVEVHVKLIDSGGNTIYKEKNITATTFKVTVSDKKSTVSVTGQLNTGGTAACIRADGFIDKLLQYVKC